MFDNARKTYCEFPGSFWTLMGGTFIDHLGGAMMFPFFAIYITEKFGVGMIVVGTVFAIYSGSSFLGSTVSGALTDKFGRKAMIIFGLVASALSSLVMPFIDSLSVFYGVSFLAGMF